jgi:Family of unknown function (DUF6325)
MIAAMTELGPVQMIAVGFKPGAKYEGKIVGVLERLEIGGALRVLDVMFVRKDPDTGELQALDAKSRSASGIVGELLGFRLDAATGSPTSKLPASGSTRGLSREDVEEIGAALEPGGAAGMLLVEHVWVRDLERAVAATGGRTLAAGFLDDAARSELRV